MILYNFCSDYGDDNCLDGEQPEAGLVLDRAGNLYGTTFIGGTTEIGEGGTVFELSPPQLPGGSWIFTTLYNFCSVVNGQTCEDGSNPHSQLALDVAGNLYGTTTAGGSGHSSKAAGEGTVFELTKGAKGWIETVLYSFCTLGQGDACPDGWLPDAGVIFDKAGNLYGTTELGGEAQHPGGGTLYELSPGQGVWTERVLHVFYTNKYGFPSPVGSVSIDPKGNLYSTTSAGSSGGGGVFQVTPKGDIKQALFNGTNGYTPLAGVLLDFKRSIAYGTTSAGDLNGTVFQVAQSGEINAIYTFCSLAGCTDGQVPEAGLIEDTAGNLYGTTYYGGHSNNGVVFEVAP